MGPKFYKQEKGLIKIPDGYQKFHVSWTLDNVISGFKHFYSENKRWPIGVDMKDCEYLPTVKTLERNFGGIVNIRKEIGIENADFTRGKTRSKKAKFLQHQGLQAEESVYELLRDYYHEPYVHNQARVIVDEKVLKLDFLVYHSKGKYAVDVFFPDDERGRFTNNACVKFNTYVDFQYKIYLVVFNPKITQDDIIRVDHSIKKNRNKNSILVHITEFEKVIYKYIPLKDPYCN